MLVPSRIKLSTRFCKRTSPKQIAGWLMQPFMFFGRLLSRKIFLLYASHVMVAPHH